MGTSPASKSVAPFSSKYRFGAFEVRTSAHELYKHGLKLKLRPQPFQILQILLERAGQVVTREELRRTLWSSHTFVDFEHGLNTSVKDLRGVLGDSASEPRYIETLPKLGYRLIAPVSKEPVIEAAAAGTQHSALSIQPEALVASSAVPAAEVAWREPAVAPATPLQAQQYRWWAVAAAIVLVLGVIGYWQWRRLTVSAHAPTGRLMLAVLPFENLTGNPTEDYFSDGLTEEMISQLGRSDPKRLGVIARTSVMHYKGSKQPLDEIGRELGVQYVLEGSVRRDSNTVRISAQLIQLKDQTHIWARQYDRQLSSLLAIQGEIAQEVSDEIQLTFGQKTGQPAVQQAQNLSPTELEAHDFYLRGRYFWNKRNRDGLQQAVAMFKQAIGKDPTYAPAYAGLADTYALMENDGSTPPERMDKARAAALKALQLDENLAEAHTSLALVTENYDYDWQTAEKEYRRAIELNPNYATAHHWYAEYLMWQGRFDEALRESELARHLDPFSLIIAADRGAILYYSHQYDRAIEQLKEVLAIDPHFGRANVIYSAYVREGRFAEALANSDRDLGHCRSDPWVCGWLTYVYATAGQMDRARPPFEELQRVERTQRTSPEPLIFANIAMRNTDAAFQLLESAYSEHYNFIAGLKVDQVYDPLRSDPRFQALLRRTGLAE